jgi:hypothetical protein
LEIPDLLEQPANENQQLDDDFLGRLSFLFEALLALQCPHVLGAVIMRRLPITPPERGQLCRGSRRVLTGTNHPPRVTGERKRVPNKMKENYGGGRDGRSFTAKVATLPILCHFLDCRRMRIAVLPCNPDLQ